MEWPISTSEAARRAGVSQQVASIIVRTHDLPTERLPGKMRFTGLSAEAFEKFEQLAAPFSRDYRRKRPATA